MFHVEWLQSALDDLASVWLDADSSARGEITTAAHEIEEVLKRDPDDQGESRIGGRRILFVKPLAAIFRVDARRPVVTIVSVWRFGRRRPPV